MPGSRGTLEKLEAEIANRVLKCKENKKSSEASMIIFKTTVSSTSVELHFQIELLLLSLTIKKCKLKQRYFDYINITSTYSHQSMAESGIEITAREIRFASQITSRMCMRARDSSRISRARAHIKCLPIRFYIAVAAVYTQEKERQTERETS